MTQTSEQQLQLIRDSIRDVPDFPKPGVLFRDITPLLAEPDTLSACLDLLAETFKGEKIDKIAAVESRGFIFGCALADRLEVGFVPVRKPGKLPWRTQSVTYDLEYGSDTIEMHVDAIEPGERVLIVDDLLATGGTAAATVELINRLEGVVVGAAFVIELVPLNGRSKLEGVTVTSLVAYE
jgi:adenine phosphoribosyltransferase